MTALPPTAVRDGPSTEASLRAGLLSDVSLGYRSRSMKMINPLARARQFPAASTV
jgi:hypothetical protein